MFYYFAVSYTVPFPFRHLNDTQHPLDMGILFINILSIAASCFELVWSRSCCLTIWLHFLIAEKSCDSVAYTTCLTQVQHRNRWSLQFKGHTFK